MLVVLKYVSRVRLQNPDYSDRVPVSFSTPTDTDIPRQQKEFSGGLNVCDEEMTNPTLRVKINIKIKNQQHCIFNIKMYMGYTLPEEENFLNQSLFLLVKFFVTISIKSMFLKS